jgi:hypothetical protein
MVRKVKKSLFKIIPLAILAITFTKPAHAAGFTSLTEGFSDISTLASSGWAFKNNSNPAPATPTATANWTQGNPNAFAAQSGASNSFIAVGPESASDPGTLLGQANNWLISPELDFSDFGTFIFYTRTVAGEGATFNHYLEVRQSSNGASTNVGSTASDVGDFSILKATVGSLDASVQYPGNYPGDATNAWQSFIFSVVPTGGSGRIAFRYYAPDGGLNGSQGGYIGLDSVRYVFALPEPSSALGLLTLGGFGFAASRRGKSKKVQA